MTGWARDLSMRTESRLYYGFNDFRKEQIKLQKEWRRKQFLDTAERIFAGDMGKAQEVS
jgi:hypothetical protein